jgi:hypothetical protein
MTNWQPIVPAAYAPHNRIMDRALARCRRNRIDLWPEGPVSDWLAGTALALFLSGLVGMVWAYEIATMGGF